MKESRYNQEINALIKAGFENVSFYDNDDSYNYFDVSFMGERAEVKTTKTTVEWRELSKEKIIDEWMLVTAKKQELIEQVEP